MAVYGTLALINSVSVGSGGQPTVEFTNIPQTYDDLVIVISARGTSNSGNAQNFFAIRPNGSTTGYTHRRLFQDVTTVAADTAVWIFMPSSLATANVFGSCQIHVSNYKTSSNKFILSESIQETNSTSVNNGLHSTLWANSASITSLQLTSVINSNGSSSTFAENTTAYLYGVTSIPAGAKATGGVIAEDSTYWYHTFTSSGVFTPNTSISCDVLVVAGGAGGGGAYLGGGGGAGGLRLLESQSVTGATTVTIGGGGNGGTAATQTTGSSGVNSSFGSIATSGGGGGGGFGAAANGLNGGSGGGSSGDVGARAGGTGNSGSYSPAEGNNGGSTTGASPNYGSGGGGGAGASGGQGTSSGGGNGGVGSDTYNSISFTSWLTATSTGSSSKLAGGGGGATGGDPVTAGSGGAGGGGTAGNLTTDGQGQNGIANTGSGGGGSERGGGTKNGGNGGSGIVIIRYAK